MERTVTVKHAFWARQEGQDSDTFFTAGNAQDVLKLPAEVQQAHLDVGDIEIREQDGTVVKNISGREV
jgi:hypothetical protein